MLVLVARIIRSCAIIQYRGNTLLFGTTRKIFNIN